MARFRFRAQPALDLRQRQLEAAQRELAEAERLRDLARFRLEHAETELASARTAGTARARQAGTITDWHWYRIWILRLEHERNAEAAAVKSRDALVEQARVACLAAKQRCESLVRFREKAVEAFVQAEAAEERKVIDELATRRHVLRARSLQGATS